jgi:hypothetical protein
VWPDAVVVTGPLPAATDGHRSHGSGRAGGLRHYSFDSFLSCTCDIETPRIHSETCIIIARDLLTFSTLGNDNYHIVIIIRFFIGGTGERLCTVRNELIHVIDICYACHMHIAYGRCFAVGSACNWNSQGRTDRSSGDRHPLAY